MTSYVIVSLQNIDDEDFIFDYNKSEGNPPYLMPAGEVVRYPKFIAKHALKHLTDKILNKRGERTNNQVLRDELANEIIIGEEKTAQTAQPTEAERLRMEIEELNKPSTLDAILAKRKEESVHEKETVEEEKKEKAGVGETFEGLDEAKPVLKKEAKPKPTRKEIYTFAEKEMNMVLDKKTTKKLDKMKIDDLMTEVQYPKED
ncbi:hypothetical protein KKC06_06845 [Patescibacteria group bacterium]|nr:hypothetical protein [Patescibacteria group bacterium]